jgi:transposase
MTRITRRNHSAAFKAKVALAAIKGDKTIQQHTDHFGIHTSQISAWKDQLQAGAADVFGAGSSGKSSVSDVAGYDEPQLQRQDTTRCTSARSSVSSQRRCCHPLEPGPWLNHHRARGTLVPHSPPVPSLKACRRRPPCACRDREGRHPKPSTLAVMGLSAMVDRITVVGRVRWLRYRAALPVLDEL